MSVTGGTTEVRDPVRPMWRTKKKGCRVPTASTNCVEAERRDIQLSTLRRQGSTQSTVGGRHHHGTRSSQQAHGRGREKQTVGKWGDFSLSEPSLYSLVVAVLLFVC
ncbi:hypothetical protein BDZ89DRAFT_173106 [Hymenopellis radicata]|nr:hypothetical protein BDZ89DRAFT_173106 [Hymenopellis radicata]